MDTLLDVEIIDGPVPVVLCIASVLLAAFLLFRRPTRRWWLTAVLAIAIAGAVGLVCCWIADATAIFEIPLPVEVVWWLTATFGAVGLAIVNLWRSRWWRKVVAVLGVVVFIATGTVQINAVFGLDSTIGDLLGIVVRHPIAIPKPHATRSAGDAPLYQRWKAPDGMPAIGRIGTVSIPATVSRFDARPAGLYLPPAALVKHAPPLPLLIMMMGYPGTPDPSRVSAVMNRFAASHHGLAPIVVVADQVGKDGDPACADSAARGHAATYIKTDVLDWAKKHLNVIDDPRYWVIAGYSNGATCAMKFAAQEPAAFRNVIAISPELFPGMDYYRSVLRVVYDGNEAAFQADKPVSILRAHSGSYGGVRAIVTTGSLDTAFGPASKSLAAAAKAAGMNTTVVTLPGVAHVGKNLSAGLSAGLGRLYPDLGLAAR